MGNNPQYSVSRETRARCEIIKISHPAVLRKYSILSLELFHYLLEAKKINFNLYFRYEHELIRFITPPEFSHELVKKMIQARQKEADRLELLIENEHFQRFINLIESIRRKKMSALLESNPQLDARTMHQFSDLSNVSQMIVKGGISKTVAKKAQTIASQIIHELKASEIAVGTLSQMILADPTLYDHSASVAMLSGVISKKMLKKQTQVSELVVLAGLFHDVGKTCVPHHILHKPDRLTKDEFEVIKTHTTLGYEELCQAISNGAPISDEVALAALEHHEKFCGGGYPNNKSGRLEEKADGIHPYSRIVTIADVFSALIMKRVYKEAYDQTKALEIMEEQASRDYDPQIFEPFRKNVRNSISYYEKKNKKGSSSPQNPNGEDKSRIIIIDKPRGRSA